MRLVERTPSFVGSGRVVGKQEIDNAFDDFRKPLITKCTSSTFLNPWCFTRCHGLFPNLPLCAGPVLSKASSEFGLEMMEYDGRFQVRYHPSHFVG